MSWTEPTTAKADVLIEVLFERYRQDEQWGEQNHPDGTGWGNLPALAEAARQRCKKAAAEGKVTWFHILDEEVREAFAERDPVRLREELVQVAAVAAAWVEAIDRRTGAEHRPDGPTDRRSRGAL